MKNKVMYVHSSVRTCMYVFMYASMCDGSFSEVIVSCHQTDNVTGTNTRVGLSIFIN